MDEHEPNPDWTEDMEWEFQDAVEHFTALRDEQLSEAYGDLTVIMNQEIADARKSIEDMAGWMSK